MLPIITSLKFLLNPLYAIISLIIGMEPPLDIHQMHTTMEPTPQITTRKLQHSIIHQHELQPFLFSEEERNALSIVAKLRPLLHQMSW